MDAICAAMDIINVYISDSQYTHSEFVNIIEWALEHCECYHGFYRMDVSDVSLTSDYVYEFHFTSQRDALAFRLVWL